MTRGRWGAVMWRWVSVTATMIAVVPMIAIVVMQDTTDHDRRPHIVVGTPGTVVVIVVVVVGAVVSAGRIGNPDAALTAP